MSVLACETAWDEAKKRRLIQQAEKLGQESAFKRNLFKRPNEQRIYVETRRIRRANASNVSVIIDVQPVAGEGNGGIAFRICKLSNAKKECLLVVGSAPGCSNQTTVLFLGEDHAFIDAQSLSQLRGPLHS